MRLQNLYRLQKELREEKIQIMKIFKESQNIRKQRKVSHNVGQILSEIRKNKDMNEKSSRKMFRNKSDTVLDYHQTRDKSVSPQKTPEPNKSNINRFTIQSLIKRKGNRYLVRWVGFTDVENTWELRSTIPEYILKVTNHHQTKTNFFQNI